MGEYRRPILLGVAGLVIGVITISVLSSVAGVFISPVDPRLTAAKIEEEIRDTHFYAAGKRVVFLVGSVLGAGCLLLISIGGYHRLGVHVFDLGKNRRIKVRWRDMSKLGYIAEGLILAEQMDAHAQAQESAFSMSLQLQKAITDGLRTTRTGSKAIDILPEPVATPVSVPTFRELLDRGEFVSGQPLLFGISADGVKNTGGWIDLYSNAIGGQSGQGKTATLRNLIAQSLLTGQVAEFWIVDYHYPHPKSLMASLGPLKDLACVHAVENPYHTDQILHDVNATIDRRLRLEESSDTVKVLVCDEVLILCDRVKGMKDAIRRIGTEARKCNIFGLFSSQVWKADAVGGSEVRDCLTSRTAHRMQRKQAIMLLQDSEQAKQCQQLKTGQVIFSPVNGEPEILSIPYCTPADMEHVFQRVVNGNSQSISQPIDNAVIDSYQEEKGSIAWISKVVNWLETEQKEQKDLVNLTGLNAGYISRILREKQPASEQAKQKLLAAIAEPDNIIDFPLS